MKRANHNGQLRREEVEAMDDDEENEVAGVFTKASADVLANRKIIRGRRSTGGAAASHGNTPSNSGGVFSGLSLPASEAPSAKVNPFAGFAGLSATTPASTPAKITPPVTANSISTANNKVDLKLPTSTSNILSDPKSKEQFKDSGNQDANGTNNKIAKLNNAFLTWMQQQMEQHPLGLWHEGVQDYITHANELLQELGPKTSSGNDGSIAETAQAKAAKLPSFSFPSKESTVSPATTAPASKDSSSTSSESAKPFTFGLPAPASKDSSSTSSEVKPFTFGLPAPASKDSSSTSSEIKPFTFGLPAPASKDSSSTSSEVKPFTFGLPGNSIMGSTAKASNGTAVENENNEEDDDEPYLQEKAEVILKNEKDDNDLILYEVECKLLRFNSEEKEWKDVGKGSLKVTKDKTDQSSKPRILVRNTMGKITLNTNMFKGMTFEKAGKNGIRFSVFNPELKKLETVMLKVNKDNLDEALSKLQDGLKDL